MNFIDKNGKEIKFHDYLNVSLDVFSNGIVIKNDKNELSLELKYESKKLALTDFDENFFKHVEVLVD
jgi:hypothetical protein